MDPLATLREIRELMGLDEGATVTSVAALSYASNLGSDSQRDRLLELIEALEDWIGKGGFRPSGWISNR